MIDERGLLAAVRSAWRGGGYEVVGNGQELESEPNPREAHRTAMTWKNWEVWQTEDLKVATFDPNLVAMGIGDAMAYGQRLVWDDEGGLLVVAPRRDDIEDALRQRLEQLPLA